MRNPRKKSVPPLSKRREHGVAMLLAIFTLLLLTAMGLALLCAADLETTIAANYRDKQVSMYSALSGLQEARDRLIPSRCANPTGACNDTIAIDTRNMKLPSLSDANGVFYIINPSNGETVAPWDPDNPYFDNELCQEHILGLTPAPGSCPAITASVPSGTGWFTTYDDSLSAAGEYHPGSAVMPSPLPFKWVRVTVKTDNMTKALVRDGANGSVVCWDGRHQIPVGDNVRYNAACESSHALQLSYNGTICPIDADGNQTCTFNPPLGSYVNPVVSIAPPGGSGTQATATAHVTGSGGGEVTSIQVTNGGHDYTTAPTVTITGDGSGATAHAIIASSGAEVVGLSSVTQQNPVGCYKTPASVAIISADTVGSGASASANMSGNTCIASWTLSLNNTNGNGPGNGNGNGGNGGGGNGNGNGFSNPCLAGTYSVSVSGGGGSGFEGSVTLDQSGTKITSYSVVNPGSGYTSVPTGVTINGLTGCTVGYQFTLGTQLQSLTLDSGGANYDTTPIVSISAPTAPAGANPPTASAILGPFTTGYVSSVIVDTTGSGYTAPPTISFDPNGGPGSDAVATATINNPTGGQIDSITLTNPGSGYTSNPAVSISGGSGASVQAITAGVTPLGRVFMLTALAVAPGGSKTMTQMEVATPAQSVPGALTIDAFSPRISPSNSISYFISGVDANSCGELQMPAKTAVGVIDNPNNPTTTYPDATPSTTAVSCVTSVLGGAQDAACAEASGVKTENYVGAQASPDVQNVYEALGDLTTPAGVDALAQQIANVASTSGYTYTGNLTCNQAGCPINLGTYPTDCPPKVVNGDFTMTGGTHGCGILLVTGTLTMQGDYTWDGPVFVIGKDGKFVGGGGGSGVINGSLFVAQDKNPDGSMRTTLGTPTLSFDIVGGGGNGIYYDHCKSDNMLAALNIKFKPSNKPLKILSVRNIY